MPALSSLPLVFSVTAVTSVGMSSQMIPKCLLLPFYRPHFQLLVEGSLQLQLQRPNLTHLFLVSRLVLCHLCSFCTMGIRTHADTHTPSAVLPHAHLFLLMAQPRPRLLGQKPRYFLLRFFILTATFNFC